MSYPDNAVRLFRLVLQAVLHLVLGDAMPRFREDKLMPATISSGDVTIFQKVEPAPPWTR